MSDTTFTPIELAQLAAGNIDGDGAFDVLMRATKAHLDAEWTKGRIKGPEYAQVYLGSVQQVLGTALQFLLAKNTANQDALLKQKQVELVSKQIEQAQAQLELLQAQTIQTQQQTANLTAQRDQILAQTALINQQKANAEVENTVLVAQECKLRAEYDNLMLQKVRTTSETTLLNQKIATEKAQTQSLGVDEDSILGRQKLLFKAQTDGFQRDAEQKAAKLMVDSWNARRMTDDLTEATDVNQLTDPFIGRAVAKLLEGINA